MYGRTCASEVSNCADTLWRKRNLCNGTAKRKFRISKLFVFTFLFNWKLPDRHLSEISCASWALICWRRNSCIWDIWTAWNWGGCACDIPSGVCTRWRTGSAGRSAVSQLWCESGCVPRNPVWSRRRIRTADACTCAFSIYLESSLSALENYPFPNRPFLSNCVATTLTFKFFFKQLLM